jgi:aspartate/methionine/tyrosine aminotransferase
MDYRRMPIEVESPEEMGYSTIEYNLAESSVSDQRLGDLEVDLDSLVLGYATHQGNVELREAIAHDYGVSASDILITPGAAAGLFFVNTALLDPHSGILVVRPNYATNIEVPRTLTCPIKIVDLRFEDGYRLDLDELASLIDSGTRLISVTYPHNPTGVVISEAELLGLIAIAEKNNCYLLVDETYRDLHHAAPVPPVAASLSKRAISVSSVSKAYGLPGLRIGWIVSRDQTLQKKFLAAKEQIVLCGSVVDEAIALQALRNRSRLLQAIRKHNQMNFEMVMEWMAKTPSLEWVIPGGGVVCFPRVRAAVSIDMAAFYQTLLEQYSTFVGPGHWFEQSTRSFRLGFGWEPQEKLAQGLRNISHALAVSIQG